MEIAIGLAMIAVGLVVAVYAWTKRPTREDLAPAEPSGTGDPEEDIAYTAYSVLQRWPRVFHWGGLAVGAALAGAGVVVLAT